MTILAAKAEAIGPLLRAELSHRANITSNFLCMESLSIVLEVLEATVEKFREKSRPLLDDGDVTLSELIVLSDDGAAAVKEEKHTRRRRQG